MYILSVEAFSSQHWVMVVLVVTHLLRCTHSQPLKLLSINVVSKISGNHHHHHQTDVKFAQQHLRVRLSVLRRRSNFKNKNCILFLNNTCVHAVLCVHVFAMLCMKMFVNFRIFCNCMLVYVPLICVIVGICTLYVFL